MNRFTEKERADDFAVVVGIEQNVPKLIAKKLKLPLNPKAPEARPGSASH